MVSIPESHHQTLAANDPGRYHHHHSTYLASTQGYRSSFTHCLYTVWRKCIRSVKPPNGIHIIIIPDNVRKYALILIAIVIKINDESNNVLTFHDWYCNDIYMLYKSNNQQSRCIMGKSLGFERKAETYKCQIFVCGILIQHLVTHKTAFYVYVK